MIKVMLVDDHQMFIDGVKSFLIDESQVQFVGAANSGEEALKMVVNKEVDVVILDVHLPGMDGETILKGIKNVRPAIKVLAVTMSDKENDIQRMLFNGADGYLLKEKGKEELIGAIHQVFSGNRYIPLSLMKKAIPSAKSKTKFTRRECEVLKLVMKGFSDKQIAHQLNIETVTVETHCRNMRKKTQTTNRVQLSNYARENNLCS